MKLKNIFQFPAFFSFSLGKYRFEIIHEPGNFLNDLDLAKLQKRLVAVAMARLGKRPDFSFFGNIEMLKKKTITICSEKYSKKDLCFCAMSVLGRYRGKTVFHAGVTISLKGNGGLMQLVNFFSTLYLIARNGIFRTMYVTSLTHTPKIFGAMVRAAFDIYPNADTDSRPKDYHLGVRELFFETYLKEWALVNKPEIDDNFVIRGFRLQHDGTVLYPDTWETVPLYRDEKYNRRLKDLLDLERGDDILQVGVIPGIRVFFKNFYLFRKT